MPGHVEQYYKAKKTKNKKTCQDVQNKNYTTKRNYIRICRIITTQLNNCQDIHVEYYTGQKKKKEKKKTMTGCVE